MKPTVTLAAAQLLSAVSRVFQRLSHDPTQRNEHFKKYNLNASTYDADYCRAYGEEYLGYLEQNIHQAAARHVDLLLFPEFTFMPAVVAPVHPTIPPNPHARDDALRLYTWSGQLFTEWLCRQAKAAGLMLAAATYTVRSGQIYNTGLLAEPAGQLALRYEKVNLPEIEKDLVTPGEDHTIVSTPLGRIGFAICFDIQFPAHQARLAERGAQIILHPSGGYALPGESADMGQNRLRVRAADHGAALVYACFAKDPEGCRDSCVIAPNGDVQSCVQGNEVGMAIGTVTLST